MSGKSINLKPKEVAEAFSIEEMRRDFPPVIQPLQLARLLGISVKTVYFWAAAGRLDGSFRKRGKHLLFWRDRAIDLIFNGPEWAERNTHEPD